MRSRYSAFVIEDEAYLRATWHPSKRPSRVQFNPQQRWLGLRIKRTEMGQPGDKEGVVEFVARYKVAGAGHRLHEVSQFLQEEGCWFYVCGDHL